MLRSQLELRDIEMDLLPAGMERRSLNQSTWDPKCVEITKTILGCRTNNDPFSPTTTGRGQLF
jgi:hypothetical protein